MTKSENKWFTPNLQKGTTYNTAKTLIPTYGVNLQKGKILKDI